MFSDVPPARGLIAEGKVRARAVSTRNACRAARRTDHRRVRRPWFDAASWQMVVAPPVPQAHRRAAARRDQEHHAQPDRKGADCQAGLLPVDTPSVANLQVFVKTEIARWAGSSNKPASPDRSDDRGSLR